MFIHPEVRDSFTFMKKYMAHNHPGWTFEAVQEAARTKLWTDALIDTNVLLKNLAFCPGSEATPIEEFERYLQEEEVLDDVLAPSEEEDF